MSAETLRLAAALMRERAEAAMPGEWSVVGSVIESTLSPGYAEDVAQADGPTRLGRVNNAIHIASWRPAVALAVADWLDFLAPFAVHGDENAFVIKHGFAVARAYLGEDA